MISLTTLRQAALNLAGRLTGTRAEIPVHFEGQRQIVGKIGDIKSLPLRPTRPVQILDTSDPNFGQFKFMAGFSSVGGPDPIG